MIPDYFPSAETVNHFGTWKIVIGFLIVLFGSFVGVEIKLGNDEDDS